MKTWIRSHTVLALAVALLLAWAIFRATGRTRNGHASPEDAIAAGWMVYPAGITGWLEVSPDGQTSIMHDTGWNGDPFAHA